MEPKNFNRCNFVLTNEPGEISRENDPLTLFYLIWSCISGGTGSICFHPGSIDGPTTRLLERGDR